MEHKERLGNLTSGELSYLWATYEYETIIKCGMTFFLQHVDDQQIKELLTETLAYSTDRIHFIKNIFIEENYPIPHGFTDGDTNLEAQILFSDALYLGFILQLIKMELPSHNLAYVEVSKPNLQEFYKNIINESLNLERKVKKVVMEKGFYIPTPRIPTPQKNNFVTKDNFLTGWFGDKRPLLGIEIAHLIFNAKRNGVGQAVITGFSQVAHSKEVRKFFEWGREIAGNSVHIFTKILGENYLSSSSMIWTAEVTDSTEAPFSDKLMMKMITRLISAGMSSYGTAMSMSQRRDLGVQYSRLMAEVGLYANDGAEIMIKNGWLEQPPIAANRKDLAK